MRVDLPRLRLFRFLLLLLVAVALACVGCVGDASEEASSAAAATSRSSTKEAADKLKAAIEKKDTTDARLGRAVARVAPMLTPAQNRSFVTAFQAQPDVLAVSTDYHARAAALDTELRRLLANDAERVATLKRPAAGRGTVAAFGPKDVFEAYVLLAQSPSASGALQFAVNLLARDPDLAGIDASEEDIVERILIPALPGAYVEKLLTTGSNRQATSATKEILTAGGANLRSVAGWLDTHNKLTGNDLTASTIRVSGRSVGTALHAVAAVMTIWELGGDLTRGDIDAALQTFVDGGPAAIGGVASALSVFRRVLLGVEESPLAAQVLKYAGHLGNGIGTIVNVMALAENAGNWNESPAAKVRIAGDIVALGASVLVLVGTTGPVGPILAGVALGIHLLADWLDSRALEQQEQRDLAACLPETGLDEVLIERIVDSHPALVRILSETVKLSPQDLQWLMSVYAEVVSRQSYQPLQFVGLQVAQVVFDLDGAETKAMLAAVIGSEKDPQDVTFMIDTFVRGLEYGQGWNGEQTKAQALEWLDRESASTTARPADRELRRAAFRNGRAFLATM
ncbi:MAG: hypothetical protein K0S65_1409 [Labilithrix sp.]|nr:hypothetical protein [Labilithrix sp.]